MEQPQPNEPETNENAPLNTGNQIQNASQDNSGVSVSLSKSNQDANIPAKNAITTKFPVVTDAHTKRISQQLVADYIQNAEPTPLDIAGKPKAPTAIRASREFATNDKVKETSWSSTDIELKPMTWCHCTLVYVGATIQLASAALMFTPFWFNKEETSDATVGILCRQWFTPYGNEKIDQIAVMLISSYVCWGLFSNILNQYLNAYSAGMSLGCGVCSICWLLTSGKGTEREKGTDRIVAFYLHCLGVILFAGLCVLRFFICPRIALKKK